MLYLDEYPEFSRRAVEGLPEAMDGGAVAFYRGKGTFTIPARCRIFASADPCPCGMLGHADRACVDAWTAVHRYRSRWERFAARADVGVVDLTGGE